MEGVVGGVDEVITDDGLRITDYGLVERRFLSKKYKLLSTVRPLLLVQGACATASE